MMLWVIFVVFFIVGPLLFRLLAGPVPTGRRQVLLGALAAGAVGAGLLLHTATSGAGDAQLVLPMVTLGLLWLAWIAVLALGVQSIARRGATAQNRRWTFVAGSAGTTVPWFGLAFASWISG